MPKRWHQFRNPWDREYAMRGSLWRGVSDAGFLQTWLPKGSLVVELGCGDGKFVAGLQGAGFRPVGLDFSRHALRQAAGRVAAPWVLADVRRLPFATASLPAVAARYVLGALRADDRRDAAAEIARALAPGGLVVCEEFSTKDFRTGTGREVEPGTYERNRGILTHYFDADEAHALFPSLRHLSTEEIESTQRIGGGRARRHRWRLAFRR